MCGGGTSPRWPVCWRWLIQQGGEIKLKKASRSCASLTANWKVSVQRGACFSPGPSAMTNRLVNNFSSNSGTCWSLCRCWAGDTGKQNRQNKSTNNLCNNSRCCQMSAREKRDKKKLVEGYQIKSTWGWWAIWSPNLFGLNERALQAVSKIWE